MKKKFYFLLLKISVLLIFLLSINVFIDAYGIFKKDMRTQILEPNKNYIKTKYILENKNNYDSFIFGSSRVGVIPVEKILKYKFYNMTYSEGLPNEWLKTLKTFIENDIKIKMIIIGIDDISFKVDYKEHFNQPMRIPYQNLKLYKNILKNYVLTNPINKYNILTLKKILKKEYTNSYINIYTIGSNTQEAYVKDKEIENNIQKHKEKGEFLINGYGSRKFINIEENIEIIKEIENLCLKNNISLIVIFNPLHKTAYVGNNEKEYKEIKERLFNLLDCSIYDFSEKNSISLNNYYWYETSHFRTNVGEMILKTIFEDKVKVNREIPNDFAKKIK